MALSGSANRLTHEYLRSHPDDAARVLERLPTEAVVELFRQTPTRLAAPVLAAMLPYAGGRCVAQLPAAIAGALLAQCSAPRAAAMLRQLDDDETEAVYAHLPSAFAVRVRRLRSYPEDTIGAWVDSNVIALSGRHTVAEANEQLRAEDKRELHRIYLIDERRRLQGMVHIAQLLHAEPQRSLTSLSQAVPHSLSTGMSLDAARRHRGWSKHCAVPVLEPSGELLGELRLGALQYARHRADTGAEDPWLTSLETFALSYSAAVAAIVRALFAWSTRHLGDIPRER